MSGSGKVNAAGMRLDRSIRALRIVAGMHIGAATIAAMQFATHLTSTSFSWGGGLPKGVALRAIFTLIVPLWPYLVSWRTTRERTTPMDERLGFYIAAFVSLVAGHICIMQWLIDGMTVGRYLLWTIPLCGSLVALVIALTRPRTVAQ